MTTKGILDIGVISVTILTMLVVGMGMEVRYFRDLLRHKGTVIFIFALQTLVPPAMGYGITRLVGLPPYLTTGILLLAACPVGDLVNVYTYLAHGNVALSLSVNSLSCVFSFVTMPAVFGMYDLLLGQSFLLAVPPLPLVLRVIWMVVLPVLAGMWLHQSRPGTVKRHSMTLRNTAVAGLAVLTLFVVVSQAVDLQKEWISTALTGALFIVVNAAAGVLIGLLLKLKWHERITAGLLFSVRNVGFALAVAITILHMTAYSVFAIVYFLTELPLLLAGVSAYRRWQKVAEGNDKLINAVQSW